MLRTFPDDANGATLRRMQVNGDDLTKSRVVDFSVVFPSQFLAERFAEDVKILGFDCSVEETKCVPDLPWDVLVRRNMIPSHADITEFENQLASLAKSLEGRNDGWGCFSVPLPKS